MRKLRPIPHRPHPREGTTLTEVLMAILCMGIGVVAVASLFPIALLRSVQATQLTSGTILRFNAETFVDLNPILIHDPDSDSNFTEHTIDPNDKYLIDPLGWNIINNDVGAASANAVGNMPRFSAGITSEQAAQSLVMLPDSWITMHEEIPVSNTASSVTLNTIPSDVTAAVSGSQTLRLVMFNGNENLSETRFLTDPMEISGNTISWSTEPNLPSSGYSPMTKVRIEVQERRYTWLLTVRNFTTDLAVPQALVDVVIFFRRSPSAADETTFVLNGTSRSYTVGTAGTDPGLKKGNFMLDTDTGAWHRVQKVDETTDPHTITLERNTAGGLDGHTVVFMRGVIDVYPLGTKP